MLALQRMTNDPDIPIAVRFVEDAMGWRTKGGFNEESVRLGVPYKGKRGPKGLPRYASDMWEDGNAAALRIGGAKALTAVCRCDAITYGNSVDR